MGITDLVGWELLYCPAVDCRSKLNKSISGFDTFFILGFDLFPACFKPNSITNLNVAS